MHRKSRYRSRGEKEIDEKLKDEIILPENHKNSSIDNPPRIIRKKTIRVGRRRSTTPIPSSEIPMVIPQKVNQGENQDLVSGDKFADTKKVSDVQQTVTLSKRKEEQLFDASNETSETPANNLRTRNFARNITVIPTRPSSPTISIATSKINPSARSSYRKSPRYQANASYKVEAISTESTTQRFSRRPIIRSTEKMKMDLPTTPLPPPLSRGTVRSVNRNMPKQKPDILEELEDENYPEHFKMLLKANYQSKLSSPAPSTDKVTKFQNFKTRRVVPYRGYKQGLLATPATPNEESSLKENFPHISQDYKRSRNFSIESNDVYVNDLDSIKDDINLAKETNYPEGTTTTGRFSAQIQQKEKLVEVTTFKPKISKILARNKLFRQRTNTVDSDLNGPPARKVPLSISEVS